MFVSFVIVEGDLFNVAKIMLKTCKQKVMFLKIMVDVFVYWVSAENIA